MSGHPQGGYHDDGYGQQGREAYYDDHNQGYYDHQDGYQDNYGHQGNDGYYDEA